MGSIITTVLVDFGGVIAEEGFREGLHVIGERNGLNPDIFFKTAESLIFETGYVIGRCDEMSFWSAVRARTGIRESDDVLRRDILTRFVVRPEMLSIMDGLKTRRITVAMLSDQTNWLDELNGKTAFFRHFDRIFNSYHIHKSKRDASVFSDVCGQLGARPGNTLFVDDTIDHIVRAQSRGLITIHFRDRNGFQNELNSRLS